MTTKTIKVTFNGEHSIIRAINASEFEWMKKDVLYPTQFENFEGSHLAYVSKGIGYGNGKECECLFFHFHNKLMGKVTIDSNIQVDLQWTNGYNKVWCNDNKNVQLVEIIESLEGIRLDRNGVKHSAIDMEGVITLDNGKFLIKDYGKYKSGLCYVSAKPIVEWEKISQRELNYSDGDFEVVYGFFYKSKKGTDCFKVMPKSVAPHMLVRDNWGGPFVKYRGYTLEEDKALYYRRASSNGGGSGYDYAVYDKGFTNKISEEDI